MNSCMKTPSIMGLDIDISACTERSFFYGEKVQGNFAIPFKWIFAKTDRFFDRCFQRNRHQSDRCIQMCKCFMGGGAINDRHGIWRAAVQERQRAFEPTRNILLHINVLTHPFFLILYKPWTTDLIYIKFTKFKNKLYKV